MVVGEVKDQGPWFRAVGIAGEDAEAGAARVGSSARNAFYGPEHADDNPLAPSPVDRPASP
jgi:hypothetical protein